MALIKCTECKKAIADDAVKCPNCGTVTAYAKKKKIKYKKIILLVIILLFILSICILLISNQKKQNDKVLGTWVNETIKYDSVTITIKPYKSKKYKTTTTDSFTFNSNGTCVNDFNILSENIGNQNGSSSPCKYKIKGNKITITWLDDNYWTDENDNDVKTLTMPFIYGGNYIVIDDIRYEKK